MNPVQQIEMPQLYGHCMHAGGWPKLGWQHADHEHSLDAPEEVVVDEAVPGLYS